MLVSCSVQVKGVGFVAVLHNELQRCRIYAIRKFSLRLNEFVNSIIDQTKTSFLKSEKNV